MAYDKYQYKFHYCMWQIKLSTTLNAVRKPHPTMWSMSQVKDKNRPVSHIYIPVTMFTQNMQHKHNVSLTLQHSMPPPNLITDKATFR